MSNSWAILNFDDTGNMVGSWTFADELGVLLQFGKPDLLLD